jgi:hypothetical protein
MIRHLNQLSLKPVPDVIPSQADGCAYRSLNPRAFDSARAIQGCLDRPSETAGVNEYTICRDPSLLNYRAGAPYGSQKTGLSHPYPVQSAFPCQCPSLNYNISSGQIGYYIDPSIKGPFYSPIFDMPAQEGYVDYTDPMDSWKPCYTRRPQADGYSCLSFINDTSYQREDIMALQMNKFNRSRSEPFL